ncbi:MAG TPA: DUF4190 domain-containing protein [Tepidisphaeraceae bacterium]|nr:DUF4190 domain-containing protein [Tepidisphaeraceae bacterium]
MSDEFTASPAHTQCPHCGFAYAVSPEQAAAMAGREFACTNCGRPFTLSAGGAAYVSPPTQHAHVTYASAADVKSNPLAIASLICGCLLCVPFAPGIASIVTGAIGLRKTRDPAVTGKGMAIAGLVLGVVNLLGWAAYFALIAAILFPSLGRSRETANRVKCASNMRQIGLAVMLYSNEHAGAYPDTIEKLLLTQDITGEVFVCPSTNHTKATGNTAQEIVDDMAAGGHLSYVYVGKGMTNSIPMDVAQVTVVAYEPLSNHNSAGANMLFADGHVEFIPKAQAVQMIKQVEAGQNPPSVGTLTGTGKPATAPLEIE